MAERQPQSAATFPFRTDRQPVIIAARRTPICRANGALKTLHAHELLAPVLRSLLADAGAAPESVADVVIGNAVGGGGNVARLAALEAGLPGQRPRRHGGPSVRLRTGRDRAGRPARGRRRQRPVPGRRRGEHQHGAAAGPPGCRRRPRLLRPGAVRPLGPRRPGHGSGRGECGRALRHQPGAAGRAGAAQPPAGPGVRGRGGIRRRDRAAPRRCRTRRRCWFR